ncbi:hypothetical protein K9M74_01250 [Candidatus Woesearchaeota archaeon]|nr:hypothetical protein [Candidatus Woesearchaeota archaeon]
MIITLISLFLFSNVVLADVERDIFIIDEDGKTTYKYQYGAAVDYGYYLESQEMTLLVPQDYDNVKFYDSDGAITGTYDSEYLGSDIYVVKTKEIEYNEPYEIGFTAKLPDHTTVRYQENYFFEYPYYKESGYEKEVYVCTPTSASSYVASYDSSPEDDWRTLDYPNYQDYKIVIPQPIYPEPIFTIDGWGNYKSISDQLENLDICPSGYTEHQITNIEEDEITTVEYEFQISSKKTGLFSYKSDLIEVEGPKVYQSLIERNIKALEPTLSKISTRLNLNSPSKYYVTFVSNNDKVLDGDNALVSYEDGTVYFKTGIIAVGDDDLIQINLLRGIINSAILNTYGTETYESWWTNGVLTNLAFTLMKEEGLSTKGVTEILNDVRDSIDLMTTNEIIEFMNDETVADKLLVESAIVDELDKICPDHAIKINKFTKGLSSISFKNDKQLNNYLLVHLDEECTADPTIVFEKYNLEHDNAKIAVKKYNEISNKLNELNIDREDIVELNTVREKVQLANQNLEKGDVVESLKNSEEAIELFDGPLQEKLAVLKKYSQVEQSAESIPKVFSFPGSIGLKKNMDLAIQNINSGSTKEAERNLNDAQFWINNSSMFSILFYLVLIGIVIGGYFLFQKQQQGHQKNPKKYKH